MSNLALVPSKPIQMPAGVRKMPAVYKLIADLQDQRNDFFEALQEYGDHTVECHWAPTVRCTCGWRFRSRQLGLKVREEG